MNVYQGLSVLLVNLTIFNALLPVFGVPQRNVHCIAGEKWYFYFSHNRVLIKQKEFKEMLVFPFS